MTAGFVTKKINNKKRSLGAILKSARSKNNISIEEAEAQTKIAAKYLIALEGGRYNVLPAEAYNVGFVRTYAQFLKLNPEKIIQLYRDERSERRVSELESGVQLQPRRTGDWIFLITPKIIGIASVVILFGVISSYIVIQVKKFAEPPALDITNVPAEFTSNKDTVTLEGKAAEGAIVSMNAEPILVRTDGSFSQEVQLSPGVNQIVVLAKNRAQKEAKQTVTVLYKQDFAKAPQRGTTE